MCVHALYDYRVYWYKAPGTAAYRYIKCRTGKAQIIEKVGSFSSATIDILHILARYVCAWTMKDVGRIGSHCLSGQSNGIDVRTERTNIAVNRYGAFIVHQIVFSRFRRVLYHPRGRHTRTTIPVTRICIRASITTLTKFPHLQITDSFLFSSPFKILNKINILKPWLLVH